MEIDFIPFKIGMQYENWEFDLEPLEFAKYYDKYEYISNDILDILGFKTTHIYLFFSLDILFKVEIEFKIESSLTYHFIVKRLNEYFQFESMLSVVNKDLFERTWTDNESSVQLQNDLKCRIIRFICNNNLER